ncbi:hypothetical protein LJB95_00565 [Paludibacteraceae bacterium OttesenSCG-928-F17]|nr:hypothetical protein [Paludibacteraceae bacterium OttesenSCG-928-F17]
MKKLITLISLLPVFFFFTACNDEPKPKPEPEPEDNSSFVKDLAVSHPSEDVALFQWDGNGDSYELHIHHKFKEYVVIIEDIKDKQYLWEDAEEGIYSCWRVQAKKGENYSEWAELKEDFTITSPKPSVEVEFKGKTWTAVNIPIQQSKTFIHMDSSIPSLEGMRLIAEEVVDGYATIDMVVPLKMGTVNLDDYSGYNLFITYHELKSYTDPMTQIFMGDWIFMISEEVGTITVESMDDKGITGELKVKLINYEGYYGREDVQYEEVIVRFKNIKPTVAE